MDALKVSTAFEQYSVAVRSELFEIDIEIDGRGDRPQVSSDFALWLSLPIAMVEGRDIHIEGVVSSQAIDNAHRLTDIWSKWLPERFSAISISADHVGYRPGAMSRRENLMLFSGGLDSSYSLLRNYLNPAKPVSLLTVHGMDYQIDDAARFNELLDKTRPLTSKISGSHYLVRSNAAKVMDRFGVHGDIGHGFHLFAILFLFEDLYSSGSIASDCSVPLEFVIAPWGTNHVTNPLFAGDGFKVRTLDNDVDRSQKAGGIEAMLSSPEDLTAVTFCKDRKSRPHNCGVCSKCIRTKAMFYTETGKVPAVFVNMEFQPRDVGMIDISKRGELTFMLDLLASARRNGRAHEFTWLSDKTKMTESGSGAFFALKKLLGMK